MKQVNFDTSIGILHEKLIGKLLSVLWSFVSRIRPHTHTRAYVCMYECALVEVYENRRQAGWFVIINHIPVKPCRFIARIYRRDIRPLTGFEFPFENGGGGAGEERGRKNQHRVAHLIVRINLYVSPSNPFHSSHFQFISLPETPNFLFKLYNTSSSLVDDFYLFKAPFICSVNEWLYKTAHRGNDVNNRKRF